MAQVTIDIPEENVALLLEITGAMGLRDKDVIIKETSPNWHHQILRDRLESFKAGKAQLTSWDEFSDELDREDNQDGV